MKKYIFMLLTASLIFGCSDSKSGKSSGLLPKASGKAGEMIVVMDSAQWKNNLGKEIRATFQAEVSGLPREEYLFKLNRVDPRRFNDVLKSVRNILFVVTLDSNTPESKVVRSYFTKSSLNKIKDDADLFLFTVNDEFAKGQEIMYLFGQSEEQLIDHIQNNREKLQNYFNEAENERLKLGIFKSKEKEGISDMLVKEHEAYMRIPFGYKLVVNEPGFIWTRQINDQSDKNIFITYKDYTSKEIFTNENLIVFRDSVAAEQLFEDPEYPDTKIVTETSVPYIPVASKEINFNGLYAVETKGLWKTANLSMGGPFLSYAMVDEDLGRFYYIEGFVYSPGKSQREFMREMKVILSTFRTKAQIPASN